MDVDGPRNFCETRPTDLELIHPIWKALQGQRPLIIGSEDVAVLIPLAGDLNRGFHAETRLIGHPEPQFSAVALRENGKGD